MHHEIYTTLILVILSILSVTAHRFPEPVVSSPWGYIRGNTITSRLGRPIFSFRGIRYAEPPVDDLRFKAPVPIQKVEGIYNATADGPICAQPGTNDTMSDDCLFLNVYTTSLPHGRYNPKRPIIVYIHPGAFYFSAGASTWVGPQYFLDQDIVLVTFNWRIGALGFASTGDKEAQGNNGLKDQVVVLKWVQKNIASFGGDPNSVTILGYSAGAWSVVLHMVSPMSKGLFHKAASLSGSPVGVWQLPHNLTSIVQQQARILNCPDNSSVNIFNCLRTKSVSDFANSVGEFLEYGDYLPLLWSPVIEPDVGEPRFLTDHPISLIARGEFHHVPYIAGRTTEEFSYAALFIVQNQTLLDQINRDFEKIAPIALVYERDTDFSRTMSRAIKKFYFNDRPIDQSQETALKEVFEDSIVGFAAHRAVKLLAQFNTKPVYYYRFSYQGQYSYFYLPGTTNTTYGVVHHDDLIYLFYNSKQFPLFKEHSPKEIEMVTKLTTLYYNFAKTGNPTPRYTHNLDNVIWEPYHLEDRKYLDIGKSLIMKEKLLENRFQFWETLLPLDMYLHKN